MSRARRVGDDILAVLPAWIVARVLVAAAYIVAIVIADRLTPGRVPHQINEGPIAWDGTWYHDIATGGYAQTGLAGLRFFPLLPLLGRVLGLGFASAVAPALVVVANLSSLALLVFVRRLVIFEGKGRAAAMRSVWLMALFPSAFVLVWGYAEALMLAAVVGGLWAARRHAWALAALAGFVAATSRPLGMLFALPVAIELARVWMRSRPVDRVVGSVAVAAPILTAGAYLLWVRSEYGDALLPFRVQDDLRGTTINPFSRVWEGLGQVFGPERLGDGLHIPFAVLFVVLLVLTFRYWPVSYGVFATAVLAAALSGELEQSRAIWAKRLSHRPDPRAAHAGRSGRSWRDGRGGRGVRRAGVPRLAGRVRPLSCADDRSMPPVRGNGGAAVLRAVQCLPRRATSHRRGRAT